MGLKKDNILCTQLGGLAGPGWVPPKGGKKWGWKQPRVIPAAVSGPMGGLTAARGREAEMAAWRSLHS